MTTEQLPMGRGSDSLDANPEPGDRLTPTVEPEAVVAVTGKRHPGRMARVPIGSIVPGKNSRASELDVADLVQSLDHAPLLQNIVVRPVTCAGGTFEIVAGHRRVEALRQKKWSHVDALVVVVDDATAELLSLEENLRRRPPADQASALARLKALYADGGATGRGGDRRSKAFVSNGHDGQRSESATAKVSELVGQSERQTRREIKIGSSGIAELKKALEERKVTLNEAERLAGRPPDQQRQELNALLQRKAANDVPVELRRAQDALAQVARTISRFCEKQHAHTGLAPTTLQVLRDRASEVVQAVTALEAAAAAADTTVPVAGNAEAIK